MNTSLDTVYLVSNTDAVVTLEIIIGATGQTAQSIISVSGGIFDQDAVGSLPETVIGTNRDLIDNELSISSVIVDMSPDTNVTEMLIRLRGGIAFREYHLSKVVDNENEAVPYVILIHFINI